METKTILIADDDEALTQALAVRCKELGFNVQTSSDGLHAYQCIVKDPPDLLIVDMNMPGAGGLHMCEELVQDDRFAAIPMIVLTGDSGEETVKRCSQFGAHYVWKGLNAWEKLRPLILRFIGADNEGQVVREAKHAADSIHPTVLVVDDDPDVCKAFEVRLGERGYRVITAEDGQDGFRHAMENHPDVVITDYTMPNGQGNYLLGKLRTTVATKEIPVFVLSGRNIGGRRDYGIQREMIGLGACQFFPKPVDFDALVHEIEAHLAGPLRVPAALPARRQGGTLMHNAQAEK